MMSLAKFNYLAPGSLSEVCSMLKEHKGNAEVIAGGTDILVSMKQRVKTPQYLIGLKGIKDLNYIKKEGKEIKIGAMTTLSELEESALVKKHLPMISKAAGVAASPLLRNMGTIGGNICLDTRCCYYNQSRFFRKTLAVCLKFGGEVCHVVKKAKRCYAVSQADTVPALIALGAQVKIESAVGQKVISLEALYNDDGKDYLNLKGQELISEVAIPMPPPHSGGSYQKLSIRKAIDFPLVGAAVSLSLKGGICEDIRVVLGAAGSCPVRVGKAEEMLKGRKITDALLEEASALASKEAKPVANVVSASAPYRKDMARVMMKRAVKEALATV